MMRIFRLWLHGSRPYIALHYFFPTAFGVFLGGKIFGKPIYTVQSFLLCLAVFFSFQTSIIMNDISDIKTDTISKRRTPLSSGRLSLKEYQRLGIVFLIVSLILALITGYRIMLIVLLGHILHFLYSAPPFRLKRFFPLSILMLAAGALLAAIAGYALHEPARPFFSFPLRSALFVFIPLLLALNFRDLTDHEGDRKTNVNTLFTIFGLRMGRIINAALVFLSYVSVPAIIQYPPLLVAAIPLGLISCYICLRVPFEEKYIFYIYFVLIIILAFLFNLKPEIIVNWQK